MKKNKKEILILSILVVIFSIMMAPKTFQNDTFFTIAGGQRVLKYGLEEIDRLTWHENLEFTNDRYIFDIIIASIYNWVDFLGIYLFVMILSGIIGFVFFQLLVKRNFNYILSFFSTLFIMYVGAGIIAARAQIISILLFIVEIYCIEKLLETNYKRYWTTLIFIPIILANIHASIFPVYFIFFLPYIAEAILFKIPFIKNEGDKVYIQKRKYIKSLIFVMILDIFCGYCTPLGLVPFTSMLKATGGISSQIIAELEPIVPIYNIGFMTLNIIFIAILAFTKTKINISDLFLFLGLDLLSLSANRTSFYFIFVGSIVIIKIINNFLEENNIYKINIAPKLKKFFYCTISIVLLVLCIEYITCNLRKEYVDIIAYPVEACEYIKNNLDYKNMKIYNSFNFGSYLEFEGIKSFIDSRSGMFCEEFNQGVTILEDYNKISSGTFKYNEIFEKYGITHAILYIDEIVCQYMLKDNSWESIYQDDSFVLFEKVDN